MFLTKTLLIAATLTAGLLTSPPAAAKPGRVPEPAMTRAIVDRPDAYVLVDPNIDGKGNPGMVFQENMAGVRRVATGRYCLRSMLTHEQSPVTQVSVDGPMPRGGFAIAVSDLKATYCSNGEEAVATYIIINGCVRPSNTVRFVGDSIG